MRKHYACQESNYEEIPNEKNLFEKFIFDKKDL